MLRKSGLAIYTVSALLTAPNLFSQASVPYSVSTVKGSTIIQNYYDPNATRAVGPGLAPSPLESRWNEPLGVPRGSTPINPSGPPSNPVNTSSSAPLGGSYYRGPSSQIITNPTVPVVTAPRGTVAVPVGDSRLRPRFEKIKLPAHFEEPTYLFPGLVARYGKEWVGSDYLYDMPVNMGVVIEVVLPEGKAIDINPNSLKQQISGIFAKLGINPDAEAIGPKPPLPFFHVLILAYPTDTKYVAYVSGRLFEEVKIDRLHFEPNGTLQAITWEKQDLVITSPSQFNDQLTKTVDSIGEAFIDRIRFFQELQLESDNQIKLRNDSRAGLIPYNMPPQHSMINDCPPPVRCPSCH